MIHRIDPPAERARPVPRGRRADAGEAGDAAGATTTGWAVEVKWDGVRAIAYCRPGRVRAADPQPQRRHRPVPGGETALAPDRRPRRRPRRRAGRLRRATAGRASSASSSGSTRPRTSVVRRRMKSHPVTYVVFDLLYLDGRDLKDEPYSGPPRAARRASELDGRELADARLLGRPRRGAAGGERPSASSRASSSSASTAPTSPASAPAPG